MTTEGPIFHESGAVLLRAVRDPKDSDRVAYLCVDCCPSFERVEAWFSGRGVDIRTARGVTDSELGAVLKELGAECDELHYVRPVDVERKLKWGGHCERCRDRARFNWIRLSEGGWARRDYEDPAKSYVICPDCMGHHHVHIPSGKNLEAMAGRCRQCANRRNRKSREVFTHRSGAICLESVRDPEHTSERAAFICSNWASQTEKGHLPNCLGVDFGWFNQFEDDNWGGRCGNCSRRFEDNPRTVKTDWPIYAWAETHGPDGPFVDLLAWVRYSRGGEKDVPVWFIGCEHEALLSRSYIATLKSAHKNRKTVFSRWCPPCVKNPEQLAATLQAQVQNSGRQKNEGAERKQRGGARNIKWSRERRALLLTTYKDVLPKVQKLDPSLPENVRNEAALRGNKPSEVALSYAASLIGAKPSSYLETVLTQAKEEAESARYSNPC